MEFTKQLTDIVEVEFEIIDGDYSYSSIRQYLKDDLPEIGEIDADIMLEYNSWLKLMTKKRPEPTVVELENLKAKAERQKIKAEKDIETLTSKISSVKLNK